MNSTNPFQVPSCFQIDAQRRSRERFKKGVIGVIAATVLLLTGLLIEGCKSERASAATAVPMTTAISANPQIAAVSAPRQKIKSILPVPQTSPVTTVTPQSRPSVSKPSAMQTGGNCAAVYVVKSGDTLTRIAKTHGVTVKSLKIANGLAGDRILVGAKLKIPTA